LEILEQKCRGGYADWDLTPEEVEKYEVAEYLKPGWTDMFMDQGIELDDEQK